MVKYQCNWKLVCLDTGDRLSFFLGEHFSCSNFCFDGNNRFRHRQLSTYGWTMCDTLFTELVPLLC